MKSVLSIGSLTLCALLLSSCSNSKNEAPPSAVRVQASSAEVSLDTQLLNLVHNYDKLTAEERIAKAEELIEAGANVNGANELGEPLLADAVHFGDGASNDFRLVKLLVEKGADVNAVGPTGRSPLTKAAESGQMETIGYLLENGLEVNNENGTRAAVKAAFFGHKQVVRLLLDRGLKPSGPYAKALEGLQSEETQAAARLFGAYVDMAKEELRALLQANPARPATRAFAAELARIERSCERINDNEAFRGNMSDFFDRRPECSSMGRLGSLAYMHCYGLLRSKSASLRMLQDNVATLAAQARSALQLENVSFEEMKGSAELAAHYQTVRAAMAMYQDLVLPWTRVASGRMSHHFGRNRELQAAAKQCGNREIMQGSLELARAESSIKQAQTRQIEGFKAELAALDKMRENISFQLPAMNATQELRRREELKRKEEEERRLREEQEKQQPEQNGQEEAPESV